MIRGWNIQHFCLKMLCYSYFRVVITDFCIVRYILGFKWGNAVAQLLNDFSNYKGYGRFSSIAGRAEYGDVFQWNLFYVYFNDILKPNLTS